MPMNPKTAWSILCAIGTVAASATQVSAATPRLNATILQLGGGGAQRGLTELKLSTWLPKSHPIEAGIDGWARFDRGRRHANHGDLFRRPGSGQGL
ncbi:MAG: hypothetical protein WDN69_08795 [Aliidongia sp.]